jgi:hypothetical protein
VEGNSCPFLDAIARKRTIARNSFHRFWASGRQTGEYPETGFEAITVTPYKPTSCPESLPVRPSLVPDYGVYMKSSPTSGAFILPQSKISEPQASFLMIERPKMWPHIDL